ncbi:lipoprotein N-acyltransferase Lnb domain-containing protein [Halotalea alkalilenta]|uniref:Lnb N-terminal periplasmic domain-containing protein n=1 Tax=Halotalea alkalilenta TaxID=376489 RepID=A0A172YCQ7_9GAMM|nr:DUF4105 domain-containing protein [Halotalea alkalilenta]ANF57041.1 hypothetical protein A5892_05810 [Halotalea alkalilenta]
MNPHPSLPRLLLNALWRALLSLVVIVGALWGAMALSFQLPAPSWLKGVTIGAWALLALLAVLGLWRVPRRWHRGGVLGWLLAAVLLGIWWGTIQPSNLRDWAPDVARILDAEVDGSRVTLHNVRNFEWRTRDDFTERWETREYDLDQLESVDLLVSYWMGPTIAHTLVSFGFADGRQLVFSVEIRRERNETFSALGGFFKQFEVALVASDERDIVRTRSNVRGEEVYLYHVELPRDDARALFLSYLDEARELRDAPRFYNTLTTNCTTLVFDMVKRIVPGLPKDIRLILSGYLPDYIYDLGGLPSGYSFEELKRLGRINQRAVDSDQDGRSSEDFSRAIREGVPGTSGSIPGMP